MKKIWILTIVCLSLSLAAQAKDNSGVRIAGGFGITTMYYGDLNAYKDAKSRVKASGFISVGYEQRLVKFLAIQAEINYLNRGAKTEFTNILTNQKIKLTLNVHTMEIPVLLKFYIGNHFNLYLGPCVYFNLAANTSSKFYNTAGNEVGSYKGVNVMKSKYKDSDGNKPFKPVDFGMDIGLEGVIIKGFFIGGRVNQGFFDMTNNNYKGYLGTDAVILPGDGKWVGSTSASLYAGYRF